jgi:signal transduction histidine kinase
VVVSVKDTGIGIPPEKLTTIFDMFSQVDRSLDKSQGGLGIGLTLVRRLVEMHDGRVEARSEGVGRGAEFVVRLSYTNGSTYQHGSTPHSALDRRPGQQDV